MIVAYEKEKIVYQAFSPDTRLDASIKIYILVNDEVKRTVKNIFTL